MMRIWAYSAVGRTSSGTSPRSSPPAIPYLLRLAYFIFFLRAMKYSRLKICHGNSAWLECQTHRAFSFLCGEKKNLGKRKELRRNSHSVFFEVLHSYECGDCGSRGPIDDEQRHFLRNLEAGSSNLPHGNQFPSFHGVWAFGPNPANREALGGPPWQLIFLYCLFLSILYACPVTHL